VVEVHAGLDVSDKSTHICVADEAGAIVRRGLCATDPEVRGRFLVPGTYDSSPSTYDSS
jgi:transposase